VKVSDLAEQAGVTPGAIRFYETQGILPVPARAENGYRQYDEADVCRLRVLVSLRALGLDLPESGRLASMCAADDCDGMAGQLVSRLADRRREVAAARIELDHLDAELAALERALASGQPRTGCCLGKEDCP
jgi:MerR family transcriptional regulator, copper efflux regulator